MESKLKALKVVDLKDILSKASVSLTGKANKQDLIAKILASPAAVDVYNKNYGPKPAHTVENASTAPDSIPEKSEAPPKAHAPPSSTKAAPFASSKSPSHAASKADPVPVSPTKSDQSSTNGDAAKPSEDEELAKRKARAERFGIPLVEPKSVPASKKNGRHAANGKAAKDSLPDDPSKLAARQARFGVQAEAQPQVSTGKTNGRKRQRDAPPEGPVDPEELERRKKRAERFATSAK